MLKLAILFSGVFLASAQHWMYWDATQLYIERNKHKVNDEMISEIETRFTNTKAYAPVAMEVFHNVTQQFREWVDSGVASEFTRVEYIRPLLGNERDIEVCTNSNDTAKLERLGKYVKEEKEKCGIDELNSAAVYVESIKTTSDEVLLKIANSKEVATQCNQTMRGSRDISCSPSCCKLIEDGRITEFRTAALKVGRAWLQIERFLSTHQDTLYRCISDSSLELHRHADICLKNIEKCVNEQIPFLWPDDE